MSPTTLVVSGIGVTTPRGDTPAAATTSTVGRDEIPDDWFDYKVELGRRGYKYLPAAAQYVLAATKRALADAGTDLDEPGQAPEPHVRGAAVGTNSGASELHASMDRTVVGSHADELSPVLAPYFSINLFGSRLATEHMLQGFNLTLTSVRVAGLEAVQIGSRSVALGRASWLLAGATEAPLDAAEPGSHASECGAVALLLEPAEAARSRGAQTYGRCLVHTTFLPPSAAAPDSAQRALAEAAHALGIASLTGVPVTAVLDDSPVAAAVAGALGPNASIVPAGAGCLEPLLQAAGALAAGPDESLLVTAAAQGNVAVARLIRSKGDDLCGPR